MNFPQEQPVQQSEKKNDWWKPVLAVVVFAVLVGALLLGLYFGGVFNAAPEPKGAELPPDATAQAAIDAAQKASAIPKPLSVAVVDFDVLEKKLTCPADATAEKCAADKKEFIGLLKNVGNIIKSADYEMKQFEAMASNDKSKPEFQLQQERAFAGAGWVLREAKVIRDFAQRTGAQADAQVVALLKQADEVQAAAFAVANKHARRSDKGCILHATKSIGDIVCPADYNTLYSFGVNGAANCPEKDQLCNRCTGHVYPVERPFSNTPWNNSEWAVHTGPADGPKDGSGSKLMSYSGIYVVDGRNPNTNVCNN